MILHRVTLNNVGVYRGHHTVILTPPDLDHPVTLIGALNGGGKTTLLGALQIGLYGARAQGIDGARRSYHRHLKELINRFAQVNEGASIELEFERWIDGKPSHYHIIRSWSSPLETVEEQFQVLRDGIPDPILTDHWDESIDSFLPPRLANLFFFDGEQIERMADKEEATKLLASAFQSLLGLDLVNRLQDDLTTLERKKRSAVQGPLDRERIKLLDDEFQLAELKYQSSHDALASVTGQIAQEESQLNKLKEVFKNEGGDLFLKRDTLEKERATAADGIEKHHAELLDIICGCAPLLLVRNLLVELGNQADLEILEQRKQLVGELEAERDKRVLSDLKKKLAKEPLTLVKEVLQAYRTTSDLKKEACFINPPRDFTSNLHTLLQADLPTAKKALEIIGKDMGSLNLALEGFERLITSVPDVDSIAKIQFDIELMHQSLVRLIELKKDAEEGLREAAFSLSLVKKALQKENERHVNLSDAEDHDRRVLEHIPKLKNTLSSFRNKVIARHIEQLEKEVLESFQHLARKSDLVGSISISPISFEITLYDPQSKELPFNILSAGERQLLATAMLWALAKVSARPIPLVIDTPLGRLDSNHRNHIVKRYFPIASHQVVLLSTDEEINGRYFELIKPHVGNSYLLSYSKDLGSRIEKGYFPQNELSN